jgi:CRP/FNR family transcriptional regulator, nitrogen oxide reductase regulator
VADPVGPNAGPFEGLATEARAEVLARGMVRQLASREVLERQGEPAGTFYLVESGYLKLTQLTREGDAVIVRFIGPGEPYGGVVALHRGTYPVTAEAVGAARVRCWPRPVLLELIERHPRIKTNIMEAIAGHMTDALTRVRELATARVPQRLARTLLRLTARPDRASGAPRRLEYPLSRQELAELTGTTLFTVSRILSQWEADGLLESSRQQITILAPRRLERIASEGDAD